MSGPVDSRVRNGERVPVQFGAIGGVAGVQQRGELLEVAFAADLRLVKRERTGTVDGTPVEVTKAERAAYVPGLVVLTVRRTGD